MHGVEKPTEHHTLLGFIVSDSCPKAVFGLKGQEFDKAIYVKGNLDNSRKSTTPKTHIQEKSIESKKSKTKQPPLYGVSSGLRREKKSPKLC